MDEFFGGEEQRCTGDGANGTGQRQAALRAEQVARIPPSTGTR